jgi:hypothetical protein
VEGFWYVFFLAVVLKIPVIGAMVLIWWAIRAEPVTDDAPEGDGHDFKRWDHDPKPRHPRRGPHGAGARPLPECPPGARTRVAHLPPKERAGQLSEHA